MQLIRRIHKGRLAIVRDRDGDEHLVRGVKVVLHQMKNYLVRLLTGILDDGSRIQIVLERVRSVLEHLRDLVRTIVPPVFGLRFRFEDKVDFAIVWGGHSTCH